MPPNSRATGDVESMGLLAGQSVGLVRSLRPARDVVREVAAEALATLERLRARDAQVS